MNTVRNTRLPKGHTRLNAEVFFSGNVPMGWVLLLFLIWGPANLWGQTENSMTSGDWGYVKLYYKQQPDSLIFNGEEVTPKKNGRYTLEKGFLDYRAVLACHKTITGRVNIVPGRNHQVRLIFEHFMTPDLRVYRRNRWEMLGLALAGGGLASWDNGRKYGLPLVGVGLAQQFFWKHSASQRIDPCSGELLTPNLEISNSGLFFGLTSTGRSGLDASFEKEFAKQYVLPGGVYNLTYQLKGEARAGYSGSYGLQVGFFKKVGKGGSQIRLTANVFPSFRLEGEITDSLYFFQQMKTTIIETESPLIVAALDTDYKLWRGLNKEFFLTFGAYASNKISTTQNFILEIPNFIANADGDKDYGAKMSFQIIGVKTGVNYQYRLNNKLGMYFTGDIGFITKLDFSESHASGGSFSFSSGLFYVL